MEEHLRPSLIVPKSILNFVGMIALNDGVKNGRESTRNAVWLYIRFGIALHGIRKVTREYWERDTEKL